MQRGNPKEYYKQWRNKNREKIRKQQRLHYHKHKTELLKKANERYHKNSEKVCKQKKIALEGMRKKIIELLGTKCNNPNCPIPKDKLDIRTLQIDHVNGNGSIHRKKFRNVWLFYKSVYEEILNGSKDYQLLCAYCNWLKRYEKKEFPNLPS